MPYVKIDYSKTLFLPKTNFAIRSKVDDDERRLIEHWESIDLYERMKASAVGRTKFTLHDGPPYANGRIHIGHAINKILKDFVVRSKYMAGYDIDYVPGWDCHGLPIEWKVEEEFYSARGLLKPDFSDSSAVLRFRDECRKYADHWVGVQLDEFRRLGVVGDFKNPYKTMDFSFEANVVAELHKFAVSGQLYCGSKPVMWSVLERTVLAEAEVDYEEHVSDSIYVKFPLIQCDEFTSSTYVLVWTTTPWTIPGNRAIGYSENLSYGVYVVTEVSDCSSVAVGDNFLLADEMAEDVLGKAKANGYYRLREIYSEELRTVVCSHPLSCLGYEFTVPLLQSDHVTDDTGTGFVHIAPSHGPDDFILWLRYSSELKKRGICTRVPFTVDDEGKLTKEAPGFEGETVIDKSGDIGSANKKVIGELKSLNFLIAHGRIKHQYPHSWRSKKPVIYRNTPQWFICMDRPFSWTDSSNVVNGTSNREGEIGFSETDVATLRSVALDAVERSIVFYPDNAKNRLVAMISCKPDWVLSRQRVWGVPIALFVNVTTGDIAPGPNFANSEELVKRIKEAFLSSGSDVWFYEGAEERFLEGLVENTGHWKKLLDVIDVWFDSGTSHLVCRNRTEWPVDMYLEGSDQHRGWFQSSLLASCGIYGSSPYKSVLTHGFVLDDKGRKMSKSIGNTVAPNALIDKFGVDALRLWVASTDFLADIRVSTSVINVSYGLYRKIRTTLRWMLGVLSYYDDTKAVAYHELPELERFILHKLVAVTEVVLEHYSRYEFKSGVTELMQFVTGDLSAFYFDIRKDALYCDPESSLRRTSSLTVMDSLFSFIVRLFAPIVPFVAEEAWRVRYKHSDSVHLSSFPDLCEKWSDGALGSKWIGVRKVRRVITGALEVERMEKRIGSSLEAAPDVYVTDEDLINCLRGVDLAEVAITSSATLHNSYGPEDAFRLVDVGGVAVVPSKAIGKKCARSWKISVHVGDDTDYPDVTPRDAEALREFMAVNGY